MRIQRGVVGACFVLGAGAWAACGSKAPPTATTAVEPSVADVAAPVDDASHGTPKSAPGTSFWKGTIAAPGGVKLPFSVIVVVGTDGAATGTISVPQQKLVDLPLAEVVSSPDALSFSLIKPGAPAAKSAHFAITWAADGASGKGQLSQFGMQMPLELVRVTSRDALTTTASRRQTPHPPYPYTTEDVHYTSPIGPTTLAGTLSLPEGLGAHAAVLFITGSGAQDRDNTIFDHKSFLVLADALTRAGIVCLRVDDRGIGGSGGSVPATSVSEEVTDLTAGIAFLRTRPEVDPKRIGVIGHSEGGVLGPMLAADPSQGIAFVVMLGGLGVSGREVLARQTADLMKAEGGAPEAIAELSRLQKAALDLLVTDAPPDTQKAALAAMSAAERKVGGSHTPGPDGDALFALVSSRWYRSFIAVDPATYLPKVGCPVLAMNGTLDVQVAADDNLAAIAKLVASGGNRDVTTVALPGLNHLFQTAKTGLPSEYAAIEETLAPDVITRVVDWVRTTSGVVPR